MAAALEEQRNHCCRIPGLLTPAQTASPHAVVHTRLRVLVPGGRPRRSQRRPRT